MFGDSHIHIYIYMVGLPPMYLCWLWFFFRAHLDTMALVLLVCVGQRGGVRHMLRGRHMQNQRKNIGRALAHTQVYTYIYIHIYIQVYIHILVCK